MLVRGSLWILGLEPTADRLMQVNLAIHLALAILLAFLAYYLATTARPASRRWPILTALHCGLFILLFPPVLYWGQNVSLHSFTVLPLLVVAVAGRWLRASLPTERRRSAADLAVGFSVFLGTMTDLLFWFLIPYLLVVRAERAWRRRPRTSDPWRWTVLFPFVAAMVVLFVVSLVDGRGGAMTAEAAGWTVAGRLGSLAAYFKGHFDDSYRFLGFFCAGLALVKLVPRERRGSVPWVARGVLLDLFVPVLAFTFVLAPQPVARGFAAIECVPFVALAWTVLTPLVVDGFQGRRKKAVVWALYVALAFLSIWPGSSGDRLSAYGISSTTRAAGARRIDSSR
jgi:hypothetical protein